MGRSGGQGKRPGSRFLLLRPNDGRLRKLKAKVRSSRQDAKAIQAEHAASLKAAEAGHAARLKAVEAENGVLAKQLAVLNRRMESTARTASDPALQQPFFEFLRYLTPLRVVGHSKLRAGRRNDGGYIMLDDLDGVRTAISAGIGREVSWDVAMAERGIDVIQLDHTVTGPPVMHPRFSFHQKRLSATSGETDLTLADLISSCPGDDDSVLCKLDIEGSEWEVFSQPVTGLGRCRQIVMEFHKLSQFGSIEWRARAVKCLEQITAEHQCIHVHGNNCTPVVVVGGVPFPSTFEATFVLRKRYAFEDETDFFPTPLDSPNSAKLAELVLGRFPNTRPERTGGDSEAG